MAAMLLVLSAPMVQAAQERCVSQHQHCRTMNLIASCCCAGDHHQPVPAATDTQSLNAPAAGPIAAILPGAAGLLSPDRLPPIRTAPLRGSPPDLLTLYATLLI